MSTAFHRQVTWFSQAVQVRGLLSVISKRKDRKGLSEDVVRLDLCQEEMSQAFLLEFRLRAFPQWFEMESRIGHTVIHPVIDYQSIIYYASAQATRQGKASLDEVRSGAARNLRQLWYSAERAKATQHVACRCLFLTSVSMHPPTAKKLSKHELVFLLHS